VTRLDADMSLERRVKASVESVMTWYDDQVMSYAKQITATEFKARCLRLLDEVADSGETLVVTKRGRPVVRVEPSSPPVDLRGSVKLLVAPEKLVEPLDIAWDAERA
jgi:prevent-host-death family protein